MSGRLLKESALCCNALYAHAAWARGACNPFDFMNKMNHKQPTKKKDESQTKNNWYLENYILLPV